MYFAVENDIKHRVYLINLCSVQESTYCVNLLLIRRALFVWLRCQKCGVDVDSIFH